MLLSSYSDLGFAVCWDTVVLGVSEGLGFEGIGNLKFYSKR